LAEFGVFEHGDLPLLLFLKNGTARQ
jgi:hypothetical protein